MVGRSGFHMFSNIYSQSLTSDHSLECTAKYCPWTLPLSVAHTPLSAGTGGDTSEKKGLFSVLVVPTHNTWMAAEKSSLRSKTSCLLIISKSHFKNF